MGRQHSTPGHKLAGDLRKAGIPAKASKCGTVLTLPTLGGEDAAALRMIHPAVQKFTLRTRLVSQPKP